MNVFILIIIAILGVGLGTYLGSRKSVNGLIAEHSKKKAKNKNTN